MKNLFIIEIYWEPSIPENGIWDRSSQYPGQYSEQEADAIIARWPQVSYRKMRVNS